MERAPLIVHAGIWCRLRKTVQIRRQIGYAKIAPITGTAPVNLFIHASNHAVWPIPFSTEIGIKIPLPKASQILELLKLSLP